MLRIGIAGANGHLGSHLVNSIEKYTPHQVIPIERGEKPSMDLDAVFIAVRPQDLDSMLNAWDDSDIMLISFVAGVPISYFESKGFPNVIRSMCNLDLHSVAYYPPTPRVAQDYLSFASHCFGVDEEDELNVLTSVVGSGLAYTISLMEQMSNYLTSNTTMPAEWCESIILELFQSASNFANNSRQQGLAFGDMIASIASKGGTTEAGLEAMPSLEQVLHLATIKSRELGSQME